MKPRHIFPLYQVEVTPLHGVAEPQQPLLLCREGSSSTGAAACSPRQPLLSLLKINPLEPCSTGTMQQTGYRHSPPQPPRHPHGGCWHLSLLPQGPLPPVGSKQVSHPQAATWMISQVWLQHLSKTQGCPCYLHLMIPGCLKSSASAGDFLQ